MDGGAWWAAVHGVAKSRTLLSHFTFTFHFHALEKEMATHSSVLAWRIPETGEPDGLPSMGSRRVGHDWSDLAAAAAVPVLRLPCGSTGKESACNAGDPGSIPRLGRSSGEGINYPLQYLASQEAQLVKNLSAMQKTCVRSLGWEDPLEKATATHSSILAWRSPWTILCMGSQRVRHYWPTFTFIFRIRMDFV